MFGFSNFIPQLDEYRAFYSVESPWIGQIKRIEASDRQLQAGVSSNPKRKTNSLFVIMGETAQLKAGGGDEERDITTTASH